MEKFFFRQYYQLNWSQKQFLHVVVYTWFIFFVAVTITDSATVRRRERAQTIVRINQVDNCLDSPPQACYVTESKISFIGKKRFVVNANGTCDRSSRKLERLLVNITKCSERSGTNCGHFTRLDWRGSAFLCPMLESRITPWYSVLNAFQPRVHCENKKGLYTLRNVSLDFKKISQYNLPLTNYYITQSQLYDETNSEFFCVRIEIDFPRVRS